MDERLNKSVPVFRLCPARQGMGECLLAKDAQVKQVKGSGL